MNLDAMVMLDTFRALHEHEHQLAAYCRTCEPWAVLDLERLIAEGRGDYVFEGHRAEVRGSGGPLLERPVLRALWLGHEGALRVGTLAPSMHPTKGAAVMVMAWLFALFALAVAAAVGLAMSKNRSSTPSRDTPIF